MTSDATVLVVEALTAWTQGPVSFLCVWAILTAKPWRHVAQIFISYGQLYGCILYCM